MFTALLKLFQEPDPHNGLTEIDFEEQNAGYLAAYLRLSASVSAPPDPVAYARDPEEHFLQELLRLSKSDPSSTPPPDTQLNSVSSPLLRLVLAVVCRVCVFEESH